MNQETITCTLSWYKILPPSGFNLIRVKQRLHKKRNRVCESSSSRHTNPKSFTPTTRWNLENPGRIYHGIAELQHLIDSRQMALLREPFDESKKVLQQYCYNQDWMKDFGLILWYAVAFCQMSKTFWQTGQLRMKDDLGSNG